MPQESRNSGEQREGGPRVWQQQQAPDSHPSGVPAAKPAPGLEGQYPGQPGYKWQPPAAMKAFMQYGGDIAVAPTTPAVPPQGEHRMGSGVALNSSSHSKTSLPDQSYAHSSATETSSGGQVPRGGEQGRSRYLTDSSLHSHTSRTSDPLRVPPHSANPPSPSINQTDRNCAPPDAMASASAAASIVPAASSAGPATARQGAWHHTAQTAPPSHRPNQWTPPAPAASETRADRVSPLVKGEQARPCREGVYLTQLHVRAC